MIGSRVFALSLASSFVVSTIVLTACTQAAAPDPYAELRPGPKVSDTADDATEHEGSVAADERDDDVEAPEPPKRPDRAVEDPAATDGGVSKEGGATKPTPPSLAKCCEGKGTCVPASAVPAEAASKLKQDTCTATNLCAPTESLGGGAPKTCEAQGPFGQKGAGVCVSTCVDMGSMGASLKQGACDADHKCAPCKVLGQATGLPGCPAP